MSLICSCFRVSAECHTKQADPGQSLELQCSGICVDGDINTCFTWLKGNKVLKRNSSYKYIVPSVTVAEVGGQNYTCRSQINESETKCFRVCGGFTVLHLVV